MITRSMIHLCSLRGSQIEAWQGNSVKNFVSCVVVLLGQHQAEMRDDRVLREENHKRTLPQSQIMQHHTPLKV